MKGINGRRERSPLRRWVLIQELPGTHMGRGRVRGRVGGVVVRMVGGRWG